jgi:ABC-type lipoprotein export system ATPase subunit
MLFLEARGLAKTYRNAEVPVPVFRSLDLAVRRGEMLAIVGPSGIGKSTLLHLLGGLDRADYGAIAVDGRDLTAMSNDELAAFRNRNVGFVFQFHHLLPEFSAEENVAFPHRIAGVVAGEARRLAAELLDRVGLSSRRTHRPLALSGGEQQRVAIARALVNEPDVILADEPTGNLDSRTSVEIMEVLQRLNRERGLTVLLITHEADIAEYARRVVAFRDGRVVRDEATANPRDAARELASLPPLEEIA